jgi:hypothetical protein
MSNDAIWQPLRDELRRLADAGRSVSLWFRDDDAIEPTAPLERLLEVTRSHAVPLSLAVIPAFTGAPLAERLQREAHASVTVHGWSHENHAAADRKKQELGADRPQEAVLAELRAGFGKLETLYPQQFVPVLVPPWNRIAQSLLPHLKGFGYRAVSVYGPAKEESPIAMINTHVDIMDWHGTGGCRSHADLVGNLTAELKSRREGHAEPIGLLTHHLVHDAAAWDFIARLFKETAGHPVIRWRTLADLLG